MKGYPGEYLYDPGHEWVLVRGDRVVVGITEFAQSELEEIVHVELPDVGRDLTAGDTIGSVESIKAVAELFTPVGGRVAAINPKLAAWPAYLNEDPHGNGWLIELTDFASADLDRLLSADAYEALLR